MIKPISIFLFSILAAFVVFMAIVVGVWITSILYHRIQRSRRRKNWENETQFIRVKERRLPPTASVIDYDFQQREKDFTKERKNYISPTATVYTQTTIDEFVIVKEVQP